MKTKIYLVSKKILQNFTGFMLCFWLDSKKKPETTLSEYLTKGSFQKLKPPNSQPSCRGQSLETHFKLKRQPRQGVKGQN